MVKEIKEKKWYKKWWGITLIIFGIIILFGIITDPDSSSEQKSQTSSCSSNWTCTAWSLCSQSGTQVRTCTDSTGCNVNQPLINQNCAYTYKIGDSIQAGQFSWKITKVQTASQVGEEFYGTLMGEKADGIFIILSVEVKNTGTSAEYLMDSFLILVDEEGREFSPSSSAAIWIKPAGSALLFEQVNPGITKKGKIVYDVPTDVKSFDLKIADNLVSNSFSSLKFGI